MNSINLGYIVTSAIVIIVQILLLKNIQIVLFDRFTLSILVYPAVIIFLPLETKRTVIILLAFFIGLFIDMFYDSPGVHTAALVLTAFIRHFVLKILEPRQGYRSNITPNIKVNGTNWFLTYLAILLFVHIFTYFSIDVFTFVFFIKIMINSIFSFAVSYLILILYKILV